MPATRRQAFRRPFFTLVAFAVVCSGVASAATLSRAFAGDCLSEFVEFGRGCRARRGSHQRTAD